MHMWLVVMLQSLGQFGSVWEVLDLACKMFERIYILSSASILISWTICDDCHVEAVCQRQLRRVREAIKRETFKSGVRLGGECDRAALFCGCSGEGLNR